MSAHRYARGAVNADLARAGAGIALCGAPLALVELGAAGLVVLGLPLALFAGFGLRTLERRWTLVGFDERFVTVKKPGRRPRRLAWERLEAAKLAYFSTRRDRERGWMALTLRGPGTTFAFDESLEGFDALARHAFAAARARGLALSPASARNFAALGLTAGEDGEAGAPPSALVSGWGSPAEWRR